ncbi:L-2-hydroxyglutarate oxidase [Paracoccus sp. (in: a-proteobacteria)]|uniref:L-2-hydroxyglutarate oxidase n=1 Tax=Paracoccus sp. TaxID=267 RepID=UPI003A8C887B
MTRTADILIVGGGIIGFGTALELQRRNPRADIVVLEKEAGSARHQSGHNSGVIHAGVYYKPGSLKARFCREGVAATYAFCAEHDIPVSRCGKLIVATDEHELARMADLGNRARRNGIEIQDVDAPTLRWLEPHINGLGGLLSPSTGIVDYARITDTMARLFVARGGTVEYGQRVLRGEDGPASVVVRTTAIRYEADRVITCAGLHADRIIRAFGQKPGFRIIPFRGEMFRLLNQPPDLVSHLIYPVPDPERPFLGVHLTRKIGGGFTVGPNAVLALKREGYDRYDISASDMLGLMSYPGFWIMIGRNLGTAMSEMRSSLSKTAYLKLIRKYCDRISLTDLAPYPAGVRAQAVTPGGSLVDDFLFVESPRCLHVGNAPSPAATAAIPISAHIADRVEGRNEFGSG